MMPFRLRHTLAALAALALLTPPLAVAGTHRYPHAVTRQFVRSCASGAVNSVPPAVAKHYCTLTLHCIERYLTLKQFLAVERSFVKHQQNRQADVLGRCANSALRKVGRG